MPNVPKIVKRRNIVLHAWCMPYAFVRTDQKDQNSVWDYVCSILFRERRRLSRSETRKRTMATRPLEGKRRNIRCAREKISFHPASMACRRRVSRISLESRMDRNIVDTWIFRSRNEEGKYHSMKSCDPNWNGRVGIVFFSDRKHHLHLRQPGGNHNNDKVHKNDMKGKDSKNVMDGECHSDSSFYMMKFFQVRGPSVIFCCETLVHS